MPRPPIDFLERDLVVGLLSRWLKSVCGGNPNQVVQLYSVDAVLVGTFAKNIKQGRQQLLGYFQYFMSRKGLCGRLDSVIAQYTGNVAIASGVYTFYWVGDNGSPVEAQARYTFVFQPTGQGWEIVNHHSSAVP
jgi:uncharacterized protein (TIGR02246 family)